ncbi:hypothetical protein D3C83_109160 [compost metagenome]
MLNRPPVESLKECARFSATEAVQVLVQGVEGNVADRGPALFLALALEDAHAVLLEEDVIETDGDEFARSNAGIKKKEDHCSHAGADAGAVIAGSK